MGKSECDETTSSWESVLSEEGRQGRPGKGLDPHCVCETRGPGSVASWAALPNGSDPKRVSVTREEGSCRETMGTDSRESSLKEACLII